MAHTAESLSSQSTHPHTSSHPSKRPVPSIRNRLESITSDSSFVRRVSTAYDLPLIANERCGSWYISPALKAESAYFKSTDGHKEEWSFSLRRVNLQILRVVGEKNGAVIVDSTRRKNMPDSLSKTIPIWCCVLNRAIFPSSPSYHHLYTPPHDVPVSEHTQIERRIDTFVSQFLDICKPNLTHLRSQISKPLRPIWVTQASDLPKSRPHFADFHPLVLCTASRRVHNEEDSGRTYIQGAADDHEAWSCGLTPALFWKHQFQLLNAGEEDLPALIKEMAIGEEAADAMPTRIEPTSNLYVSATRNLDLEPYQIIISCGTAPQFTKNTDYARNRKYLWLKCQNGKAGSRDLRLQLPHLITFFSSLPSQLGNIVVCCPTGKDLSVGVSLAILCLYADEGGRIRPKLEKNEITKTFIKRRLAWLTTTNASLNPSRKTLLSVHAFLMPEPSMVTQLQVVGTDGKSSTTLSNNVRDHCSSEVAASPAPLSPLSNATPAIFNALQNSGKPWTFTRTLTSNLPQHPSGTVNGNATFVPFATSSPEHNQTASAMHIANTLLYSEEGEFSTTTGLTLQTRKNYIYRLGSDAPQETPTRIAVHFYLDEAWKEERVGGLFVEMDAMKVAWGDGGNAILEAKNKEQHLCAEDLYAASWRFDMNLAGDAGASGQWWEVHYIVKGPKKDYTSHTTYRRT
ncbi:hypothetical protein DM02DRAFT_289711 [Periconia macrospinosa]|uniref:tRNA A64-2'-O-ribosylphosphate transferase n=1 Tax=Periconia macrospinosa TaxID=97972 RepID=A0A2V1DXG2_9PLEO|nr:hypothetical protein DM02DRAFT_289711 [Periconia macrospinosa]